MKCNTCKKNQEARSGLRNSQVKDSDLRYEDKPYRSTYKNLNFCKFIKSKYKCHDKQCEGEMYLLNHINLHDLYKTNIFVRTAFFYQL